MRTLFVTWDGPQVSYVESLFLPIFEALGKLGYSFDILQFRWGNPAQERRIAERCAASAIGYRVRNIHRGLGGVGPFATALAGGRTITAATRDFGSDIVMPRSLMPALATLSAWHLRHPILFDADGLQADERVEFMGLRPTGAVYRILRDVEAQIIRRSAAVLTRSSIASDILLARAGPPISSDHFSVVGNGRNVAVFHPGDASSRRAIRQTIGLADDTPLLVYAGSVGAQYQLDRAAALLLQLRNRHPSGHLLILSGSPQEATTIMREAGSTADSFTVWSVTSAEMPELLAAADLGIAFRVPSFSMQAVAPVKLAEYFLCGLPVAGTAGIGNTKAAASAGVFLDAPNDDIIDWITHHILPERDAMRQTARRIGTDHFSLEETVQGYSAILDRVIGDMRP